MLVDLLKKDLEEGIEVHDTLNPKLFDENNNLKDEIVEKINLIVDTFVDILKENNINIDVRDILFMGSNANYNYTDKSDIDIHIAADMGKDKELLSKIYDCYKTLFNNRYSITLKGLPVEIYVEDYNNPTGKSHGIYSVLNKKWIKDPDIEDIPEIDEKELESRFNYWKKSYEDLLKDIESGKKSEEEYIGDIESYIDKIYQVRQEGLVSEGEYSLKNQLFKEVRNADIIDDLRSKKIELINSMLSLK